MNRLTETKLNRSIRFYNEYVDHVTNEACKKLDVLKKEFTKNKYRDELCAENKEVIAGLMANLQMAFSHGQNAFLHSAAMAQIANLFNNAYLDGPNANLYAAQNEGYFQ